MTFKDLISEKGLYAAVKLLPSAADNIVRTAIALGIPNVLQPSDIHCTLLYSRKYAPLHGSIEVDYSASVSEFDLFGDDKQILVIKLLSPELLDRHNDLMNTYKLTYDYEEYIPHITLSYDIGNFDISKIDINNFINDDFNFILEYYEDLVELEQN